MLTRSYWRYFRKILIFLGVVTLLLLILRRKLDVYFAQLDYAKVSIEPDYSKLNLKMHFTTLVSNFTCNKEHIKLLVLVTSHTPNAHRRENIRMTWGKRRSAHLGNVFRTFFVVGRVKDELVMKNILEESSLHKDIIFADFNEKFYNLPYKVEAAFEWAYKHCSYDYLLKADDDVFVNIYQVFELLSYRSTPVMRLYIGRCHFYAAVFRDGKYEVTFEEYAKPNYPDFCGGGAVLFSHDVIAGIIPYFQQKIFKIDDVYIGILIMNFGVNPIREDRFRLNANVCVYSNDTIAHHPAKDKYCMNALYYNMLINNINNIFVRGHYIGYLKE